MEILDGWDQILLNNVGDYRWARSSSDWSDYSLVYLSKDKHHGEHFILTCLEVLFAHTLSYIM